MPLSTNTNQVELDLLENLKLAVSYRKIELYKIYTPCCIQHIMTNYLKRNGFNNFLQDALILIYQYAFSPEISLITKCDLSSS